jgi:hypothetical protein
MSWQQKMRWYAGRGKFFYSPAGRYSLRLTNGIYIEVHPDVYKQRFNAYLERLGVKPKSWYGIMQQAETAWQKCCSSASSRTTWFEIMQRAENEWQDYCRIMDVFAENYQQWLDDPGGGIFVEHPQRELTAQVGSGNVLGLA